MRILADEHIPRVVINALRQHGYDVRWIAETNPGVDDSVVLSIANDDERLLLTFDKDFGHLIFIARLRSAAGIILFRGPGHHLPDELATLVTNILASRTDWLGHFSVIDQRRIRMTRLSEA